jgi:hypothetical protein
MKGNPRAKDGKYHASIKLWARAIVRDEIKGTKAMVEAGMIEAHEVGTTVGFQDREIEVQDTDKEGKAVGDPKKQPEIVVINMGMKNFFSALQASFDAYGTVLDRDYRITRTGTGLESEYSIVPMDPIMTKDPATERMVKFTLAKDSVREPYLGPGRPRRGHHRAGLRPALRHLLRHHEGDPHPGEEGRRQGARQRGGHWHPGAGPGRPVGRGPPGHARPHDEPQARDSGDPRRAGLIIG